MCRRATLTTHHKTSDDRKHFFSGSADAPVFVLHFTLNQQANLFVSNFVLVWGFVDWRGLPENRTIERTVMENC